jgi:opacity protein-like surface antigen
MLKYARQLVGPGKTASLIVSDVYLKRADDAGENAAAPKFELNFWGYGLGPGYKKLSRITPYAILGIGATVGVTNDATAFGLNLPVGVGVKYKVKPRLNLIFEWTHRFTTIDKLDGARLNDPYYIESSGMKNRDTYSFFMFTLTYDISPKLRLCNN